MNIYVGNLSYQTTDEDLRQIFAPHGDIESARVIRDKFSGQSKGFGFVEMPNNTEALSAIEAVNGKDFMGRQLKVNEARPKEDRPAGGGGRGGRMGGGGGGGGRSSRW